MLELEARHGDYITGLYQWSRNRKDQARLFYYDQDAFGVRSLDIAQVTPLHWPAQENKWTTQLVEPRSLDAAEDLLHSVIEALTGNGNLRDVATPGDLQKILCQFQLLRRKGR